jgi:hypothetical protein
MTENLGQVSRNQLEDIRVSLSEFLGKPHVELRVYVRSALGDGKPLLGREGIVFPASLLPDVLRMLTQAQELLLKRGLIYVPAPSVVQERGEPTTVRRAASPAPQASRRNPRVPVRLPVECRLVRPDASRPDKPVAGEIKDVSIGGAQVWLPQRLPRFVQVEVSTAVEGMSFLARAEVVTVEIEAKKDQKTGYHRHGLRWVVLEANAKAALSKVIPEPTQALTMEAATDPALDASNEEGLGE